MKHILLLTVILFFGTGLFAQKKGSLTIEWKYTGIVDGYDHLSKLQVYVDDVLAGESREEIMSAPHTYKISIPRGEHKIRIVSFARYEGVWEAQNKVNDYSYDMVYETTMNIAKKNSLKLHFDIDKEVIILLK